MTTDSYGMGIPNGLQGQLGSRVDILLKSKNNVVKVEEAIAILEECIDHHDILPCSELPMNKIQALAARIEETTTAVEVSIVERFMDKVLPFLVNDAPAFVCMTKKDYQISLERCIFSRVIFSVMFTLINNMNRGTRKTVETSIFTKYAPLMEKATHELFTNIDFEGKISLVELLWRGIRRVGIAKATQAMSAKPCVSFKGIKHLDPHLFEKEAIKWLESSGCLNESYGFYKIKGRMELSLTSNHTIIEQDLTEVIISPSMMRLHLYSEDNQSCLKVEIPISHMVTISLENDCLEVSFKFMASHFNLSGLWSPPLQEVVSHIVDPNELLLMKLCFIDSASQHLVETISSINTAIINNGDSGNELILEKGLSPEQDHHISEIDSEPGYNHDKPQGKLNCIPSSLMFSSQKKAEALLHYNDSVTTDDYKHIDKISKRIEFNISPESSEYHQASVSFSTEMSNSVSSCEKPYDDHLMDPSHRTMQLHEHGPGGVEPLMMSLHHYREVKAKEMNSIFKRIYREEMDQAMAEVSKLCAAQNAKRKEVHGVYKKEVEALVKEIEHNHQDLAEQLKKLLNDFDALKSNNVVKETKRGDTTKPCDGANSLTSNCSGLVQSTETAIKEIDDVIQRIKKHYIKKKHDCSRALEGLYNPKNVDAER